MNISSKEHQFFISDPELSKEIEDYVQEVSFFKQPHVFIRSSGSSGKAKIIALRLEALIINANMVIEHLELKPSDIFLDVLSPYFMGSLGAQVRAGVLKAKIIQSNWRIKSFENALTENPITVCSLIPSQLKQIVDEHLLAPASLRLLIVGGGAVTPTLYEQGTKLGWPIVLSYGATELGPQFAASRLEDVKRLKRPSLKLLKGVRFKSTSDLQIFTPSLFSGYIQVHHNGGKNTLSYDEAQLTKDGYWPIKDKLQFNEAGEIVDVTRIDGSVKIAGVLVKVSEVYAAWEKLLFEQGLALGHSYLNIAKHKQLENVIYLHTEEKLNEPKLSKVIKKFEESFQIKIKGLFSYKKIPRTQSGKPIFSYNN